MLPLAALASGEVLWTTGAERGARELLEGTLSGCSAQEMLGALPSARPAAAPLTLRTAFPKTPPQRNQGCLLVSYWR